MERLQEEHKSSPHLSSRSQATANNNTLPAGQTDCRHPPLHRQSRLHEIELDVTVYGTRSLWQSYPSTHVNPLNVPALACLKFDSGVFEGRREWDSAQPIREKRDGGLKETCNAEDAHHLQDQNHEACLLCEDFLPKLSVLRQKRCYSILERGCLTLVFLYHPGLSPGTALICVKNSVLARRTLFRRPGSVGNFPQALTQNKWSDKAGLHELWSCTTNSWNKGPPTPFCYPG